MKKSLNYPTVNNYSDFIEEEYANGNISVSYAYYGSIPQIINAFINLSYLQKKIYMQRCS